MNDPINLDFSYDEDAQKAFEAEEKVKEEAARQEQEQAMQEEVEATAPLNNKQKKKTEEGPEFFKTISEAFPSLEDQAADGKITTDEMSSRQRLVAGTIDSVMDLTSKFYHHAATC